MSRRYRAGLMSRMKRVPWEVAKEETGREADSGKGTLTESSEKENARPRAVLTYLMTLLALGLS